VHLGSGVLTLDHAAHGKISSNQVVFGWLARAVVGLLASDRLDMSDDVILELLRLAREP
jgi:hypothetical protein